MKWIYKTVANCEALDIEWTCMSFMGIFLLLQMGRVIN